MRGPRGQVVIYRLNVSYDYGEKLQVHMNKNLCSQGERGPKGLKGLKGAVGFKVDYSASFNCSGLIHEHICCCSCIT